MREEIKVTRYSCDKPDCPVVHLVENDDGLPGGFHGRVIEVWGYGMSAQVDWYACRATHIREAVEGALKAFCERD